MSLVAYYFIKRHPNMLGLIAANTYSQLSNSTLKEIFRVWGLLGLKKYNSQTKTGHYTVDGMLPDSFTPHGHVFKDNYNKIFFSNGAVLITASLENYKALDGLTLGYALLDETKDTRQEAVTEVVVTRLSQKGLYRDMINGGYKTEGTDTESVTPLYIFTSPSKTKWLSDFFMLDTMREEILSRIFSDKTFFNKQYNKGNISYSAVIASTFHNKNLSATYIESLMSGMTKDQIEMFIYGSPFGKAGDEYYSNFRKINHVKADLSYTDKYPIHISFDFNSKPYMTLIVSQVVWVENKQYINFLQEYCLTPPRNSIEDICSQFLAEWGHLCDYGLFIYGDASGKNQMPIKESRDLYKIIEREFINLNYEKRLLKQNPRHRTLHYGTLGRRDFMNALLGGRYDVVVQIDNSCIKLIADLEFMREDANGAKMKPKNKEGYEDRGHTSDALDYQCCWLFGDYSKG